MQSRKIKSLILLLSLSYIVGCKSSSPNKVRLNASEIIKDETISVTDKAEKLALAAEQLISPSGIDYADQVLDVALQLDPTNFRANLYKKFLAPTIKLKGVMARAEKMMTTTPSSQSRYKEELIHADSIGLKDFLVSGAENDVKNEADVQSLLTEVYDSYNEFRLFLKSNKNNEITLNLNPHLWEAKVEDQWEKCKVEKVTTHTYGFHDQYSWEDYNYDISNCKFDEALTIKVNRADLEGMQQIASGMMIYMTAFLSYDLSGFIDYNKKYGNKNLSSNRVYRELLKNKKFGTLRSKRFLNLIPELGLDAVTGLRWALSMNKELCKKGPSDKTNRPNHVFESGLCVESLNDSNFTGISGSKNVSELMTVVEIALKGGVINQAFGGPEYAYDWSKDDDVIVAEAYTTEIKPIEFLKNPIEDIRELDINFNGVSTINKVSDPTLMGVFPNQDFNYIINL